MPWAKPSIATVCSHALALAVGATFWLPSVGAARGYFPAPLDDVYIHFDFARALAEGHPFEWIAGQGYSSGETSPLYALLLAVGWVIGFRGRLIGLWAGILAVLSLASLVRSTHALMGRCPWWVACASALPLSVGLVNWTLVSGMEMAPFSAALGAALVALDFSRRPTERRSGMTRQEAQWRLGAWGAALCLLRPEAAVLVAIFAVLAARGAKLQSGSAALARAAAPGALATLAILVANRIATGDAMSAGAALKLLSSNPYLSDEDRARAFVENLVTFFMKAVFTELGRWAPLSIFALASCALASRARRTTAAACLLGSFAWTLLVSWNNNSPFHNFRYYTPAWILFFVGAALGIETIARTRHGKPVAAAALVAVIGLVAPRFPAQIRHFAQSVANVRDQQIEVGAKLAALMPAHARVLVGDAGAIPFVSGRSAVDALGLGGFRRMPFARAAAYGQPATVELIERLDANERPAYLALYPNWFGEITDRFGAEIDRVTIANNVICGGPTKSIYRADWSALEALHANDPDVVDEIDVADIISERAHGYEPPLPHGGWTTLDILDDEQNHRRFDGGRVIPSGAAESFVVLHVPAGGRARIRVRVDARAAAIVVRTRHGTSNLAFEPAVPGAWRTANTLAALDEGERISLEAASGEYRDYHVWITRP